MDRSKHRSVTAIQSMQLAVASAKGSPGVTSLALALGLLWPSPVIVGELDPAGGSLAARVPLPTGGGMATMAAATRALQDQELAACLQPATATCSMLLGPSDPFISAQAVEVLAGGLPVAARAAGVAGLWDLGRLWPGSPAWNALGGCDLVTIVVRPTAGELAHAIPLLGYLLSSNLSVAVVLAATGRRRRATHRDDEVTNAISERLGRPVPILGRVPCDPLGVSMAEGMMVHWAGRCALGGAVRRLLQTFAGAAGNDVAQTAQDPPQDPASPLPKPVRDIRAARRSIDSSTGAEQVLSSPSVNVGPR